MLNNTDNTNGKDPEIDSILAIKDVRELYRALAKKFEGLTRYYNFICPLHTRPGDYDEALLSSLYNTYWSCWQKFLVDKSNYFYIMNKSTGILFTHDSDLANKVLTELQSQKNPKNKSEKLDKNSPYKAKFIADDSNCLKSYALIMNLSANSSFKNRCNQNFVNMINLTDDFAFSNILDSNILDSDNEDSYEGMIYENDLENKKSYTESLVKGKNVLSLFLV